MAKNNETETTTETVETEADFHCIDFVWHGSTYTMEFNRRTAQYVEERLEINVAKMFNEHTIPLTKMPQFFYASMMMHHPNMKVETAEAIYQELGDKFELMQALIGLYSTAINSLFEEPEEGKAITWTRR